MLVFRNHEHLFQVRKLEQKLATEHLAYERKLAEQREDSAKLLAEEKAKVAKEKANFERFCREQKKKEPSPALIEQVERLRNDVSHTFLVLFLNTAVC